MIFKLYACDVGLKIDGVSYNFEHVSSVTVEDPEFNRLTRGANGTNKIGLSYKEGLKEPKTITCVINDLSIDLKAVLDAAFAAQTRVDVFAISRIDGSSKMGRNSVLCQVAQQLTLDESPESMDVSLMFQTFDLGEVHKS